MSVPSVIAARRIPRADTIPAVMRPGQVVGDASDREDADSGRAELVAGPLAQMSMLVVRALDEKCQSRQEQQLALAEPEHVADARELVVERAGHLAQHSARGRRQDQDAPDLLGRAVQNRGAVRRDQDRRGGLPRAG